MFKFLPFFFLLISFNLNAGINGVGNGGGYAEMKILSINHQIKEILNVFVDNHLINDEELHEKAKNYLKINKIVNLEFSKECPELPFKNNTIYSCYLYEKTEETHFTAKNNAFLLSFSIIVNIYNEVTLSKNDFLNILKTILPLVETLKSFQIEQSLQTLLSTYIFHFDQIVYNYSNSFHILSVEDSNKTINFTENFLSAINCDKKSNYKIEYMETFSPVTNISSIELPIYIKWSCDYIRYEASIKILVGTKTINNPNEPAKEELDPQLLLFKVTGKMKL